MTDLQKQLQSLVEIRETSAASFLFDSKTASKIDKDVIFTIGLNGFEELRAEDDRFLLFFSDLFEESFAFSHSSFETLAKAEILAIATELKRTNALISPHFMHPGCHKVIEFLIRFYKYTSLITEEVLFSLLPFHGTKYFVRLLQGIRLDGLWVFLSKHQKTGFIMRRSEIVKQCVHELRLLAGIIEKASFSAMHLKFAGAIVIELISVTSKLSESLLAVIMGFVDRLIQQDKDSKSIAMAVIGQIANRHPFSPQYMQGIISDLLKYAGESMTKELITTNLLLKVHVRYK
jgi:U3 small nucleolar RNA-associated protein 10